MPIKPGIFTSEFLGVVISWLVAALVVGQVIPQEQALVFKDQLLQIASLVIQLATLLGAMYTAVKPLIEYIKSRTQLKTTAMQQAALSSGRLDGATQTQ